MRKKTYFFTKIADAPAPPPPDFKRSVCKTKSTVQPKHAEQRKPTQSKMDTTQGCQRSLQCYICQGYGYRQSECPTKVSPGKDQKSSTLVSQSNQEKTRAMVLLM